MRRNPLPAAALGALLAATTAGAADKPRDPLERFNRATYAFNDAIDRMLARPAARGYKKVVPEPARACVSRFVENLTYPTIILNDALQGKLRDAGSDTLRFATNTVIGIGGLFDPATKFGLPPHDEDFGQTLGVWGVGPGPYLVLPVFGPSDFRDAPGRLVDHFTSGDYLLTKVPGLSSTNVDYAIWLLRSLDTRTQLLAADAALQQAFDPYVFVRNAYLARREYLVRDGNVPDETYDEPEPAAPPPEAPSPPSATPR